MMIRNGKLPHSLTYYSHRALQTSGQEHNSSIILTVLSVLICLLACKGCLSLEAAALCLPNATHIFSIPLSCPPPPPLLPRSGSSITLSTVPYQSPVSPVSTTTTTYRCRQSKESG